MEPLAIISTILALLSGIIGIFSALRSQRLAREKFQLEQYQARNTHRGSLIDDIEQVLNSVKEENGRMSQRIEDLEATNRALVQANDHLAARVEVMEAAYKVETEKNARLTERVEELEAELAKLCHLKDNAR